MDLEKIKLKSVDYDNHKNNLQPFSIVLFRGNGFVSSIIEKVERIANKIKDDELVFTHVGVLVNSQVFPSIRQLVGTEWAVMEMTMSKMLSGDPVPDLYSEGGYFGLQLRSLESLSDKYDGDVYVLPMVMNPMDRLEKESIEEWVDRMKKMRDRALEFFLKFRMKFYQFNIFQMFASAFPAMRWIRKIDPLGSMYIQKS